MNFKSFEHNVAEREITFHDWITIEGKLRLQIRFTWSHLVAKCAQSIDKLDMCHTYKSFLGEISVPLHPGITPQIVFNYLVKKASFYEFHTLPEQTTNASSSETNRVLTHILREYRDYDVSFVLSLKETKEEGVVTMEYIVLMTSRRELFPKLTLDLRLSKKSPSSGSLSTMSSVNRTVDLPENGETEQEIGIGEEVLKRTILF